MLNYRHFQSANSNTIVLLHGFCENNEVFNLQLEALQEQFSLLCIDLPGFGSSNVIKDITIPKMAEKVKELLDDLKITNCILLGHSMGGYVTLAFAKNYAQMLQGFGLIHSTAAKDSFDRLTKRKQLINFIQKNGAAPFFKTFFPDLFFDKTLNHSNIENLIEKANSTQVKGIIEAIKAMMMREETFDVLENTNLPVFFAIGKHDTIITEDDMLAQAALCQQAEICYLENSNHMGMLEQPAQLNQAILQFANRIF